MSDAKFTAVDDARPTGTDRPRRANAIDSAAPFLEQIDERLNFLERKQIRFVRKTFDSPVIDRGVRAMQRRFGAIWIEHALSNIRHVHGLERIGTFDPKKSYVCVANHRSFFDLYVVTSYLVYRDLLPQRILFPVRSNFFYDNPLGLAPGAVLGNGRERAGHAEEALQVVGGLGAGPMADALVDHGLHVLVGHLGQGQVPQFVEIERLGHGSRRPIVMRVQPRMI